MLGSLLNVRRAAQVWRRVKYFSTGAAGGSSVIRFIDFSELKKSTTGFPRCPDSMDMTVALNSIDRNNSLLIIISHCWMRGWSGAPGWDGRAHPDNADNDKWKLCVKGIDLIKQKLAPHMKSVYVWLDFSCIDQDSDPGAQIQQLDKIVECCDAIFTPIVDAQHEAWKFESTGYDLLIDYKAKLWNDGPYAYLNRGWCRTEMMYASNIPVLENSNSSATKRHEMFALGLAFACRLNRRPHFLYGNKEMSKNLPPVILPPMQKIFFEKYSPLNSDANFSVASDLQHIERLVSDLKPYIKANERVVCYVGQINESGQPHGKGTYTFFTGDVYTGEFREGRMQGQGTLVYSYGDVCQGEFRNDDMEGRVKISLADGTLYEGEWTVNGKEGQGIMHHADGSVYEGEFKDNDRHGEGVLRYPNGDFYEGEWMNGRKNGYGAMYFAGGEIYEGEWKNGKKEGQGTFSYTSGNMYKGGFKNDHLHGRGTFHFADGRVATGEWIDGIIKQID